MMFRILKQEFLWHYFSLIILVEKINLYSPKWKCCVTAYSCKLGYISNKKKKSNEIFQIVESGHKTLPPSLLIRCFNLCLRQYSREQILFERSNCQTRKCIRWTTSLFWLLFSSGEKSALVGYLICVYARFHFIFFDHNRMISLDILGLILLYVASKLLDLNIYNYC